MEVKPITARTGFFETSKKALFHSQKTRTLTLPAFS